MAESQPVWFGSEMRKRMHPVFETVDFSNRREVRKAFYNEDGEDVRQATMGVRWGLLKERRATMVEEFKEAIHEAFDRVMEKLSVQKNERSSLDAHFLPNMTTPAVTKTRSRLAKTNAREAIRVMDLEGDGKEQADVTRPRYAKASVRKSLETIAEEKGGKSTVETTAPPCEERTQVETIKKAPEIEEEPVEVEVCHRLTSTATINTALTTGTTQGISDIANSGVQRETDKPAKTRAGRPRGRRVGSGGTQLDNGGPVIASKTLPATTRITRAQVRTRAKKDPVVVSRGKESKLSRPSSVAIPDSTGLNAVTLDKAPELSDAVPPPQSAQPVHCSKQQQNSVSIDSHSTNNDDSTTTGPRRATRTRTLRQQESEVGAVVATTASKRVTRSSLKQPSVDPYCASNDDNLPITATEPRRATRTRTLRQQESEAGTVVATTATEPRRAARTRTLRQQESETANTATKRTTRLRVKKVDKVTSSILAQLTAVEPASAVRRSTRSHTKKPDMRATTTEEDVSTTASRRVTRSLTNKIPAVVVEPPLERDSEEKLTDEIEAKSKGSELSPSRGTSPNLPLETKHDEQLPNKEVTINEGDELSPRSDVSLELTPSHQVQPTVTTAVDSGEERESEESILKETAKPSGSSEEDSTSQSPIRDPPTAPPSLPDFGSAMSTDKMNTCITEAATESVGEPNTPGGKPLRLFKENEEEVAATSNRKRTSRILDRVVVSRLSSPVSGRPSPSPPCVAEEKMQSPRSLTNGGCENATATSSPEQQPVAGESSPSLAVTSVDAECSEALSRDNNSDVSVCSTLTSVSTTEDESCLQPSQAKKKKLPLKLRKTKRKKVARGKKKVAEATSDSLQDNDLKQVTDPEAGKEKVSSSGDSAAELEKESERQNASSTELEKEEDTTNGDSATATEPEKESERQESEQQTSSVVTSTVCPSSSALALPSSSSADSLYESCLSEIDPASPPKPPPSKAKAKKPKKKGKRLRVPTPYSSPAQVVPLAKTPSRDSPAIKSPAIVSSSTSAQTPYTGPLVAKSPAVSAKAVRTPIGTPSLPLSPSRLPFLMGTPKTLQKLQEEHRLKRSGGTGARGQDATPLSKRLRGPCHTASPAAQSRLLMATPHCRPANTPRAIVNTGVKRLRSVSLEKLPEYVSTKRPSLLSTSRSKANEEEEEEEEGREIGSSECDGTPGSQSLSSSENSSSEKLTESSSTKTRPNIAMSFFTKKTQAGRMELPAKLLLPAAHPVSFLPRNSPRKVANPHELRKEKLRKKVEEDERRIRDMESRKQQELREKKRQAEERLKKAAANRAALEDEKKRKARDQGTSRNDQTQLVKRAKELEAKEKSRKHKERMAAAEARRREEEEKKLKRCQEIEEERRMKDDLAKRRLEAGEHEKKQKRLDVQKQEKERQLYREATKEREEEAKRKMEEQLQQELARKQQEQMRKEGERQRFEAEKKRFEQLISETLAKSSVTSAPPQPSSFIPQWKQARAVTMETNANSSAAASHSIVPTTVTKSKPTIPQDPPRITTANIPPVSTEPSQDKTYTAARQLCEGKENSPAARDRPYFVSPTETALLNRTFNVLGGATCTKALPPPPPHPQTPTSSSPNLPQKYTQVSYEMTPASYDIADLSSEDSTDDEDCPKKPIPVWAHSAVLNKAIEAQEEKASKNMIDVAKIFPPRQLLKSPDLARIFTKKRRRFFCRSSSANWHSPMMKKTRIG